MILRFMETEMTKASSSPRAWRRLTTAAIALAALGTSAFAQIPPDAENPGSLVPKNFRPIIGDRVARMEGDLLTIIISETSLASYAASTQTSKKDKNSISQILAPTLFKRLLPNLGTGADASSTGQGTTQQSGRLSARMTAVVKQVLPNGQLVIEGFRSVRVNKETQTFFVSGVVRTDDLRSDNTVMSEYIANAEIRTDGQGAIADRTRKGILTRIIDWLF